MFYLNSLFLNCIFMIMSFLTKWRIAFYNITRFNCVCIWFYQKPHIYSPFSHQDIEWDILKSFALFLGNDKFLKSILKLVVLTWLIAFSLKSWTLHMFFISRVDKVIYISLALSYIQGVPPKGWQLWTKFWKLKNLIWQKVSPVLKSLNKIFQMAPWNLENQIGSRV